MAATMPASGLPVAKQGRPHRRKRTVACNYCRSKKVRCNGGQPCMNCQDHGEECVYLALRRRTRKSFLGDREVMENRIARMEAALREANVPLPTESPLGSNSSSTAEENQATLTSLAHVPDTDRDLTQLDMPFSNPTPESSHSARGQPDDEAYNSRSQFTDESINTSAGDLYQGFTMQNTTSAPSNTNLQTPRTLLYSEPTRKEPQFSIPPPVTSGMAVQLQTPVSTSEDKGLSSIAPPVNPYWEYHGPGSFLSICSPPGINWISEKTGVTDFSEVAKTFTRDITRPLKLERGIRPDRTPEPDPETARRYFKIYFEEAPEAACGIVVRPVVEARLRAHFEYSSKGIYDDDPEWYALRNVIYATGCRFEVERTCDSSGFTKGQSQGWRYFENALSQHTELLYCRTGLMAVQALLLMAFFVEGVGCPALEYMLCSSAMRLAQSKGMHRQAGPAWGMSAQDIEQRNLIFWMLYAYEKHVVCRSGRPSAIEDDDISCQLPTTVPYGSTLNLELVTFVIKHAQISSQISRRLTTVRAYHETTEDIVKVACALHQQLEEWRESLPDYLKPRTRIKQSDFPHNTHMYHALLIQYSYYGSLVAIHSTFTYPWCGMFGRGQSLSYHNQVEISTDIVAEASRSMILATKYINLDAWSPCWLAFYFPVVGMINIFVHVLKYPTLATTPSDVVLLDVVAGHFARLEFASSGQLAFSFVGELSRLAHSAIKKARQRALCEGDTGVMSLHIDEQVTEPHMRHSEMTLDHETLVNDLDNIDVVDFDMDNWSAFVSVLHEG